MDREAYAAMAESEEAHWWFVGRRAIIRSLIENHVRPGPQARILEAGCGTGGNLGLLASFGTLQAFEHDEVARNIARAKTGVDVKPGTLPYGIDQIEGPFDLIAMLDVLEHLEDDKASLRSLSDRLVREGKLMVTVPALQFLWSSHDELHHHYRRYSRKSLVQCLQDSGLAVNYISYFNSILFPFAVAQRLYSRGFRSEASLEAMPGEPFNSLLSKVFAIERLVLNKSTLPLGLSLCAICTKR